jgi:hypothetical protein
VFIALVPIAAIAAALVAFNVPTFRDPEAPPADRLGLIVSTAAMAALIYTIIEAPNRGWGAGLTVAGFIGAGILFALFVAHERRMPVPMLDIHLFRNLRFSAASGAVTISFFSLFGFIFLITLYFQFLKGYGPLSTGVRLLPVATMVGITSVVGTRIAVRSGTKLVVTTGLLALAAGLAWAATGTETTGYATIAGAMIFIGSGIGLRSAPATESIMGAVPAAKAGIGSGVNDPTRITGGTLGVAVIGSIYASLYSSRLGTELPAALPAGVVSGAHRSVGTAFGAASELAASGHPRLAKALHDAASAAFFHGFETAVFVAAGIAVAGAVMALILIPSQPPDVSAAGAGLSTGRWVSGGQVA